MNCNACRWYLFTLIYLVNTLITLQILLLPSIYLVNTLILIYPYLPSNDFLKFYSLTSSWNLHLLVYCTYCGWQTVSCDPWQIFFVRENYCQVSFVWRKYKVDIYNMPYYTFYTTFSSLTSMIVTKANAQVLLILLDNT